ncbi:ATP-grasp domain-containing protein [Streptomyces celluloflavus]|uniref:ATP-grasp domain-containing protein n=1 Tax=Streptomyces celluloflavus TaxID=58344 RepID=UPI003460A658|nr:ATP-grasp domain-containing protein [Streptomyces celluloflavus]
MSEHWPHGALLVLGASEEQIALYQEARRRGIPTIAVDVRPDAPALPFADAALKISTRNTGAIADALGDARPAGIVGGASDAALASWHALGLRYGTPYVYPRGALAAGDKAAFHAIATSCGITGYGWTASDEPDKVVAEATRLRFPLVIKPADGSGSKGVTRVARSEDLHAAIAHARSYSTAQKTVIAEEFIQGRPLAVEVFMRDGRALMTCIKDKDFVGQTFVVRRLRTAQLAPAAHHQLEATVERLCRALGIANGPANFDVVLGADGQPQVIEANARLGGDGVPRLLAAYGVDVVRALIALALGEPFGDHLTPTRAAHAALELIGSPHATEGELITWEGVADARSIPGITDIELYAKPGDLVRPHDQSGHKIGLLVAAGPSGADALTALDTASALLRPVIRPKGES